MNETLNVSEHFYSVQCEGHTTGYPAYFIRLMNCNLSCGVSDKMIRNMKKGIEVHEPGNFVGDLHKEGKATWTCDTIPVWIKSVKLSFEDIIKSWEEQGIKEWINKGRINIIWTGGEPTLPISQKGINSFLKWYLNIAKQENIGEPYNLNLYNEIETNGTGYIEDELFNNINQINCSVKLTNSGMSKERRIVPKALKRIMEHDNYWFKFVISTEEDMKEIEEDFIKPFNIPYRRVILMPALDSQKDFHERTRFSLEMGKKYGYIGLTRLHVSAWDKTCGV